MIPKLYHLLGFTHPIEVIPWLFFTVLIFFLCREFVCWYFKLNRITELLEQIEENTRKEEAKDKTTTIKTTNSHE